MKLTPEIETQGMRAYEQVCAFEALQRRGLPHIYAGFAGLLVASGLVAFRKGYPSVAAGLLAGAVLFGIWTWLDWHRQKARYAKNLKLVAELEEAYGDQLPWIQVENHFAELERLQREMEEEEQKPDRK
jgi:hypothetical protein